MLSHTMDFIDCNRIINSGKEEEWNEALTKEYESLKHFGMFSIVKRGKKML
jgi:hypothetical protein